MYNTLDCRLKNVMLWYSGKFEAQFIIWEILIAAAQNLGILYFIAGLVSASREIQYKIALCDLGIYIEYWWDEVSTDISVIQTLEKHMFCCFCMCGNIASPGREFSYISLQEQPRGEHDIMPGSPVTRLLQVWLTMSRWSRLPVRFTGNTSFFSDHITLT